MKLFTIVVKKWFDKVNGNTYYSVRCIRHKDNKIIVVAFQYGYGNHYQQTALAIMAKAGWLGSSIEYRDFNAQNLYERVNDYPIIWIVSSGLKRDCIANGVL